MQFIAVTRRRVEKFSDDEFTPLLPAEQEHARQMYSEGLLRQIWHRGDVKGAVLLLEADSLEKARVGVEQLPLAANGMLEVVAVIPLNPYAGFGPKK